MKMLFSTILLIPTLVLAQTEEGYHEHDGFFLSMSGGLALGSIVTEASGGPFTKMTFSGTGGMVDFKIGGTIAKTVALSFDLISRSIVGPDVQIDGIGGSTNDEVKASDVILGLGMTHYIMPINVFVNGTVGLSKFELDNGNRKGNTEDGIGLQLKIGKEWWVSKNWGLGLSGGFAFSSAADKGNPGFPDYEGEVSTKKIFLMFNTTFN